MITTITNDGEWHMGKAERLGERGEEWLRSMLLIRAFEDAAERLSLRGKIPGGVHAAAGQEAVAVGTMAALKPGDVISSGHRSHHHALAKGLDPALVMAELFTRADGVVGGRGGSMHLADFTLGHYGGNGIVGAGVGIAMGAALGIQHRGDEAVAIGFVGDGGANVGRLWECANLAAVWALPLIVVLENNFYAVETHVDRVTGGKDIARRARGFGLPAVRIDGQDVDQVFKAVQKARAEAVGGGGPVFIEATTYRYYGHNAGEVASYRTPDEVERERRGNDPIDRLVSALLAEGRTTQEHVDGLARAAREAVESAEAFAESSPWPSPSSVLENVDAWGRVTS